TGVYSELAVLRGGVGVIQSEIPCHDVRAAIAVEISCRQAVPPAAQWGKASRLRDVDQSLSIVPVELDRHPVTYCNEIEPLIAIEIDPRGIGDHASRIDKVRGDFFGHIGKMAAVVAQNVASRWIRIVAR